MNSSLNKDDNVSLNHEIHFMIPKRSLEFPRSERDAFAYPVSPIALSDKKEDDAETMKFS
jgi:hypothetical protein